jgi:hypothetical protein
MAVGRPSRRVLSDDKGNHFGSPEAEEPAHGTRKTERGIIPVHVLGKDDPLHDTRQDIEKHVSGKATFRPRHRKSVVDSSHVFLNEVLDGNVSAPCKSPCGIRRFPLASNA